MRRLLEDGWFQLFLAFSLASGGLLALDAIKGAEPPPPVPAAGPPARPASGRWVVDPDRGPGSQAATLAEAAAAAYAGDVIVLRRGLHHGGLTAAKALRIVGEGAPDETVLAADPGGPAVAVRGAVVALEKLTLAPPRDGAYPSLDVEKGGARLSDAALPGGARVTEGSLTMLGGTVGPWQGTGVFVQGKAAAFAAEGTDIVGAKLGVDVRDGGTAVLTRARFSYTREAGRADPTSSFRLLPEAEH